MGRSSPLLRALVATAALAASTAHGATIVGYGFEIKTDETGPLGSQTGPATFSFGNTMLPLSGGGSRPHHFVPRAAARRSGRNARRLAHIHPPMSGS